MSSVAGGSNGAAISQSILGLSGSFGATGGTSITKAFQNRKEGETTVKGQLGGGAGLAGGIMGAASGVAGSATNLAATIKSDKGAKGSAGRIQYRKDVAKGAIDTAANAVSAAGPWGMVAGGVLKLIGSFLKIKGPRQKRRERQEKRQRESDQEFQAKARAIGAAAPLAGQTAGGGAQMINNAPNARTSADFSALVPTGKLLGF